MANTRVTAVAIQQGVIRVIMPDGTLKDFAQRGLNKYEDRLKMEFIRRGIITPYTLTLRELPKNISIEFEDESMGRAYASFNPKRA